jgi:hypothetical protein
MARYWPAKIHDAPTALSILFVKELQGFLSLILLALPCRASAIDLTPRFSDSSIGGIVQHRLFFADGSQKISVHLDFQTAVEAGGGGAVFRFQRLPDAVFILRESPMVADQPFNGVSLERYREAAHRLLPPNVTNVEALEEIRDPITLNGWSSYRFLLSYQERGEARISSVTFVNLNGDEQLALITSALAKNFEEAADRSWQIMRTWHLLEPETPTAPN